MGSSQETTGCSKESPPWQIAWIDEMLRNLTYRYKIPLRGTVLILITATIVTASLIFRAYDDLKHDLLINSEGMSRILARTVIPALLRDDVWQAYEIINAPFHGTPHEQGIHAETVILLDAHRQIYVSTQPKRYPMLAELSAAGPSYTALDHAITDSRDMLPRAVEVPESQYIYMVTPIVSDGVLLGTLVMAYSKSLFVPRFINFAQRAALTTLLVLVLVVPVSWYWGSRMAQPLVQLASCMGRVGSTFPQEMDCDLYESRDEIGQVGAQFKRMLQELQEKEELKRQMMVSDRLAAVGRITAGIAHEINNPLGGMLNAINTFKHHGNIDPRTVKTMSLLERGLLQIKDTVGALLVEARPDQHELSPHDIEDVRRLVLATVERPTVRFHWRNAVDSQLPLPSAPVRQMLLNLLLNAAQAVEVDGSVSCEIGCVEGRLEIEVANSGKHISAEQMEHLFEPFSSGRESGHGLGLWVTYQIVQQLRGEISVTSLPGDTRFAIVLPLPEVTT
jgi:two-component system, NtrC family, sensor kinase